MIENLKISFKESNFMLQRGIIKIQDISFKCNTPIVVNVQILLQSFACNAYIKFDKRNVNAVSN